MRRDLFGRSGVSSRLPAPGAEDQDLSLRARAADALLVLDPNSLLPQRPLPQPARVLWARGAQRPDDAVPRPEYPAQFEDVPTRGRIARSPPMTLLGSSSRSLSGRTRKQAVARAASCDGACRRGRSCSRGTAPAPVRGIVRPPTCSATSVDHGARRASALDRDRPPTTPRRRSWAACARSVPPSRPAGRR